MCIILTDGCGADIDNERKILQKTDPNASVYCIGVSSGFNRKSAIEIYGEEFTYEAKDVNDVMNKFVEIAQKELDKTGR